MYVAQHWQAPLLPNKKAAERKKYISDWTRVTVHC